ncbi:holliday junction DNA helicase RuvB [Neorickettsia helminthoeca str. Oregon]|uniref:Holliday junction branch migration complex subunit RuvB n=1 Tax=Neorickettsia helminthoeca str. Oregon TaxID=1286528 RepID=X5H4M3_9RICK|nr:Holliday junction branch migration DNA helicase RuvB [Neorickettsia helminthoeca]AHX11496.1 holliday junction DNA helicase RuvB [Neorickettsia helminthoeca str. Oregon]
MRNEVLNEKDIPHDPSVRPQSMEKFVGQKHVIENLQIFIDSAQRRNDALDHILFYGPPGLGKTTLAHIISNELRSKIYTTSGPLLSKAGDIAAILTNLQRNDILFIDEIHRLPSTVEEVLYPAMEDYCLDIIVGDGPAAKSIRINLAKFTLVAATTRIGMLSNPLRDRFGITMRLEFYTIDELVELLREASDKLSVRIEEDGIVELAKRSRGTPRIALRLLKRIRDFLEVSENDLITTGFADYALNKMEIDKFGLDKLDYTYMNFISKHYSDSPVGIKTIASAISEKEDSIEEMIEPYLIKIGFLHRTPRGRKLSKKALDYLASK